MNQSYGRSAMQGMALLAVLFALTLLALLALPFAVSMTIGADAAMRDVEVTSVTTSSASVRDLLLADAAMSHPMVDPTPTFDGLDEFPGEVVLPKAFAGLTEDGTVLLGGQVVDLQRYLQLDSASPLLFANAIGTTTRLAKELKKEDDGIDLDDASALPDAGYVYIDDELIQYGSKDGNRLTALRRGQLYPEFKDGKQDVIKESTLVVDYRCVIAAAWPFLGPDPSRQTRRPYRAVGELLAIQNAGFGSFTADEMDALQRVFTIDTMAATAGTWGRPERVFVDLEPAAGGSKAVNSKVMIVKSALHVGAGSTVRLRNLRTGEIEYGLVMAAATLTASADLSLPSAFALRLLNRVGRRFPAIDTVVEPLIPAPVNINTAPREVLLAICEQIRRAPDVRMHEGGSQALTPPWFGRTKVAAFVDELLLQRQPTQQQGRGPFTGWEDLVERMWRPRFEEAKSGPDTSLWVQLYRNLQTGRDSTTEMGTAPVCFQSGPWVAYRAAASRSRSLAAAGVAARHERSGVAAAVPGFWLERRWSSQEVLEDAFLLDRRAPFWVTTPINLGALQSLSPGNDPAARYFPHLYAYAFPTMGFGEKRFPARDDADSGFMPSPATAISGQWPGNRARGVDTFAQTLDPRGHDVKKDGPYRMHNTGPSVGAGNGQPQVRQYASASQAQGGRHDQLNFPFANGDSFVERFGIGFWLEPQALGNAVLFDHGDGNPDRNRLSLQIRDGKLVWEVIDAAGLDPDPSQSPAGVERTASEWSLPVAELALPANTPLHVNISATSGRPADLSFAVDGMARGKPKFATYLTAAIKVFDPNLANNQTLPGQGGTRNERYLDVQVESTEGFPPVGCLRIGLELFEYSAIQGNSFRCQWKDSMGGRGARQAAREHRPGIPVDQNGKPTVNLNDPQFQNVNLDVFPEHAPGALVELCGYSVLPSNDTPMMVGSTKLDGAIGAWSVGRGFISNPRPITIQLGPGQQSEPIGAGIDETWAGEIELADPKPDRQNQTRQASDEICNGFPTSGGYALLVQRRVRWSRSLGAQISTPTQTGGVELVRYTSRQGNKLNGVQRAQRLPGQDGQIASDEYDGTPRKFVTTYENRQVLINGQLYFADEIPTWILFVVPVSLPVQNPSVLWDPQKWNVSEWAQIYPKGNDNDTEWVRYDVLDGGKHLVRANRAAWEATRFSLTRSIGTLQIENGATALPGDPLAPPWGNITPTSGHIGYVTQLESTWPQIHAARRGLRFRGDPFTGTSSHKHDNSEVMACQRLQLLWGNYGAYTGRVGRHDRVALLQGAGKAEPEWHTVNWQARQFDGDRLQQNQTPPERLGPEPFQLVAFRDGVRNLFLGPPVGDPYQEPRRYDRLVKFPSGELPTAYCAEPTVGGGIGNILPMTGFVDEVEVVAHIASDLYLDEAIDVDAKTFLVNRGFFLNSAGAVATQTDPSAAFPVGGGLVAIDTEIVAYQSHADGTFIVATNGRGLLNSEPRGHDRGARVKFLTHRPAAILAGTVGVRDAELPLQSRGAMPERYGTALLGRELLHYAWVRNRGDNALLEMPRWYPPGEDPGSSQSRGLFRGRFGTSPQSGSAGEAVIAFPFRHWDRHVERSDDPELAYFQLTTNEAPVYYRSLRWRQETSDARVRVLCMVRADSKLPWESDPLPAAGYWHFQAATEDGAPHRLAHQASRLEIRFVTTYQPGCLDLTSFRAHGWKTTARIEDVRLEYEGEGRVFDEQVTAR